MTSWLTRNGETALFCILLALCVVGQKLIGHEPPPPVAAEQVLYKR